MADPQATQLLPAIIAAVPRLDSAPVKAGKARPGKIVRDYDPVDADFTCARLEGLDPHRVCHLARAGTLADPILTAVHDDCLTGDKGGIVAC
jgi:hypothetical protein